ncbi:hypothetical protein NPIL_552171 [Nephila pilipes]|uniref:Uncharacterized protein n=1 Tax=Nephila pilipes TaxID=299642 RepID=A0A8X6I8E0_NEPPI|nr:hypothetical protein NPIL_552171 [Nephila pilipes]
MFLDILIFSAYLNFNDRHYFSAIQTDRSSSVSIDLMTTVAFQRERRMSFHTHRGRLCGLRQNSGSGSNGGCHISAFRKKDHYFAIEETDLTEIKIQILNTCSFS